MVTVIKYSLGEGGMRTIDFTGTEDIAGLSRDFFTTAAYFCMSLPGSHCVKIDQSAEFCCHTSGSGCGEADVVRFADDAKSPAETTSLH